MKKYIKLLLCFIFACLIYIFVWPKNKVGVSGSISRAGEMKTIVVDTPKEKLAVEEKPVVKEEPKEKKKEYIPYRLTSFWFNDGYGTGRCTGSGLCEKDFKVNQKGWYTYKGKLVLAAATYECLNSKRGACGRWNVKRSDKRYYHYYEEIELVIDNVVYKGIILDSCGACMYINNEQRIDLFVSGSKYTISRGYKGKNPALVLAN